MHAAQTVYAATANLMVTPKIWPITPYFYSYIHAGVLSARISQGSRGWREECVGEKKEKGKAESLEKKNQLSEEKLWQLGGVGPRSSNEEGENLKQETQKVQQFAELGLWGKSKLIKQNQILSF